MTTTERDLRDAGARIEALLAELEANPVSGPKAHELVRLLMDLYGAGIRRIVNLMAERPDGDEIVKTLAADPLVASLLAVHDLHPVPVEARVNDALERVRPYLGSHAGGVELLGVNDEGVVHLRLQGSCQGCPSSTVTVKLAIEQAILEAAPEVVRVEAEGVDAPLLQIGRRPSQGGWQRIDDVNAMLPGTIRARRIGELHVLVCSAAGSLYAYRNACARCGAAMEAGRLDGEILACPACDARFDVHLAGRAADGHESLEPLPLLPEQGGWKIAIPEGAGA